jgi:hypothetical protein
MHMAYLVSVASEAVPELRPNPIGQPVAPSHRCSEMRSLLTSSESDSSTTNVNTDSEGSGEWFEDGAVYRSVGACIQWLEHSLIHL